VKSCLYTGHIRHRRRAHGHAEGDTGARNEFRYRIHMLLLDLDELPGLFDPYWLWSARRPALAWFRRGDFHGPPASRLSSAVRDTVERHTGCRPAGPIRLLTHLRYFGHSFNPVSFYYVYDAAGATIETIVAEITNTPWKERHCYVLSTRHRALSPSREAWRWQFDKAFHVSPFLPMDMRYDWRMTAPGEALAVHMENWRGGQKDFDATLTLRRRSISSAALARALCAFPLATLQIVALIHWQALKLLLKRVPFHVHPAKRAPSRPGEIPAPSGKSP